MFLRSKLATIRCGQQSDETLIEKGKEEKGKRKEKQKQENRKRLETKAPAVRLTQENDYPYSCSIWGNVHNDKGEKRV